MQNDEIKLVLERAAEGDDTKGWVPAYHLAICDLKGNKMGVCVLRIGHNENLYYSGNIGYGIDEPYRGHHYAGKACLLLFELAKKHELGYVIITCDPDNAASRKTCEYAGGKLLEIAPLPEDNNMRERGSTEICIFRFELQSPDREIMEKITPGGLRKRKCLSVYHVRRPHEPFSYSADPPVQL